MFFRKTCLKMPSEDHFQSVLKILPRVLLSPNLTWLTDLFGSFWMPDTAFRRSAAGGDYTVAVGCANCSSPLQPPLFLFRENLGEVKKVQAICFSFPKAPPKQSIPPRKHKGTSVNLAPGAWIVLQVFIFLRKAKGWVGFFALVLIRVSIFPLKWKKKSIF